MLIGAHRIKISALRQRIIGADASLVIGGRRVAARLLIRVAYGKQHGWSGLVVDECIANVVLLGARESRVAVVLILRVAVRTSDRYRTQRVLDSCARNAQ